MGGSSGVTVEVGFLAVRVQAHRFFRSASHFGLHTIFTTYQD